jgi:hypothetical protein
MNPMERVDAEADRSDSGFGSVPSGGPGAGVQRIFDDADDWHSDAVGVHD